jgi:hypothetical protein
MKKIINFKQRNLLSGQLLIVASVIFFIAIIMSLSSCSGNIDNVEPESGKLYNGEITLKSYINGQWLISKHEFIYSTVDKMSGVTPPTIKHLSSCPTSKVYTDRFNIFIKSVKFDNFSIKNIGETNCPK